MPPELCPGSARGPRDLGDDRQRQTVRVAIDSRGNHTDNYEFLDGRWQVVWSQATQIR